MDHMIYQAHIPRGMVLQCRHCTWIPSDDVTMGVVVAHFATEPDHDNGKIAFNLVVLCPRCDKPMQYDRTIHPDRDQFSCPAPCYRTRTINRNT